MCAHVWTYAVRHLLSHIVSGILSQVQTESSLFQLRVQSRYQQRLESPLRTREASVFMSTCLVLHAFGVFESMTSNPNYLLARESCPLFTNIRIYFIKATRDTASRTVHSSDLYKSNHRIDISETLKIFCWLEAGYLRGLDNLRLWILTGELCTILESAYDIFISYKLIAWLQWD